MNAALYGLGTSLFAQGIFHLTTYLDKEDEKTPYILTAIMIGTVSLGIFLQYGQPRWGESRREHLGRLALQVPFIKKEFIKDIQKQKIEFQESFRKKWSIFPQVMTTIPEKRWEDKKILAFIDHLSKSTLARIKDKQISGTIYSKSLEKYEKQPWELGLESFSDKNDYFEHLSSRLKKLFTYAFEQSYLWNALHSDEFSVGAYIQFQVVRMVASMFGGKPHEVMGFVTSGGTESLMLAIRAYRNLGMEKRGHQPGEGVVIASKTVHAAVLKAGSAYSVKIHLVDVDDEGRCDLEKLKMALKKFGNKVIAIIGSAPCYSLGVADPIEEMGRLAKEYAVGMHVDICLGGYIINHLGKKTNYLSMEGITSASADTHKNGLAPKGSSVLMLKDVFSENLAYYAMYSLPEWDGGVYGTPKDPGSESCTQALNALIAMLATGQEGYQRIAQEIHENALVIGNVVSKYKGKLKLLVKPEVNVVAFQIDKRWIPQKGATYAFAYEMSKRHFILNTLKDDRVHYCITLRFSKECIKKFDIAVKESLEAVEGYVRKGKNFPGDAGMYCALEAAMNPSKSDLSTTKYVKNFLLGEKGAKDAVKSYFLAQQNPYS